jgi:hypothetical protein
MRRPMVSTLAPRERASSCGSHRSALRGGHPSHQPGKLLSLDMAAWCEGEALAVVRLRSDQGTELVDETPEARSRPERFEPTCRPIAWRSAPMILL